MTEKSESESSQKVFAKKIWISAGIISLFFVLIFLFKILFSTLMLVLAGVLLAVYFIGCARLIEKLHIPYTVSVFISVAVNIALVVGFFWFVGSRLEQQANQLSDTLPQTIQHLKDQMGQSAVGKKTLSFLHSSGDSEKTKAIAKKFFSSSFGILSDIYIILLLALFFIASPSLYKKGFIHLLPPSGKEKGVDILNSLHKTFKNWIIGKIVAFFFIAIFTGLALWIIGMPLVLTLALIAGLLNFIPNFGPLIALIPAVLLALMQGTNMVILVVVLYTVIQILQSAVTQPLIQQKMVKVPPAMIIFAQVVMGMLAGFWGVLLATPVVVIIMEVVNELYVKPQHWHKFEFKEK